MDLITVYTPTFNRGQLLTRVYDSLCRQTYSGFVWLIIDDGSTDTTKGLVDGWLAENILKIKYVYRENGGLHTARDMAYRICDTELIVGCDSDDYFVDNAIEQIIDVWKNEGSDYYAGIITQTMNEAGECLVSNFPDVHHATYQDFTYKHKCVGDKKTILRTSVIAAIPENPVFPGEKFLAEGFKWIQLPENRPFLLVRRPLYVIDYQTDGYSNNVAAHRYNNPNGFRASSRQHIISSKYLRPRIKGHIGYIAFSIILKDQRFIINSPNPLVTMLLLPLGLMAYIYFAWQRRKHEKNSNNHIPQSS